MRRVPRVLIYPCTQPHAKDQRVHAESERDGWCRGCSLPRLQAVAVAAREFFAPPPPDAHPHSAVWFVRRENKLKKALAALERWDDGEQIRAQRDRGSDDPQGGAT